MSSKRAGASKEAAKQAKSYAASMWEEMTAAENFNLILPISLAAVCRIDG